MKKVHLSDRTFRLVFSLGLLIVLGLFLAIESVPYSTDAAALRVGGNVERRVRLMDKYVSRAIDTPNDVFLHLEDLPHDIVIYRYVNDSLQSWCNQFTEINDDISSKLIFSRVTNTPNRLYSPLAKVGPKLSYVNMGPKWYLVKAIRADEETFIIAGLEIKNTLVERHLRGRNGINPKLRLVGGNYNIAPLSEDSGSPVLLDGVPVFKVTRDLMASQSEAIDYSLFSPLVYADGPVLSSLVSFGYLWNMVRVQGGAYGTGMNVRRSGDIFCYSYRDPNLDNTRAVFSAVADFIEDFAAQGMPLDDIIIGAVNTTDPLLDPAGVCESQCVRALKGVTPEDLAKTRHELLATKPADLAAMAGVLRKYACEGKFCTFSGANGGA